MLDLRCKSVIERELHGFEPAQYARPYCELQVDLFHGFNKEEQVRDIADLMVDMILRGANSIEMARAIRHSMVIMDALRCNLDWKQSYIDNRIGELKAKYQVMTAPYNKKKIHSEVAKWIEKQKEKKEMPPKSNDIYGNAITATYSAYPSSSSVTTNYDKVYKNTKSQIADCTGSIVTAFGIPYMTIAPKPVKIIYNDPATVVFWDDKTKTVVKCTKGQKFDPYAGFCAALAKKLYKTNSAVTRYVKSGENYLAHDISTKGKKAKCKNK